MGMGLKPDAAALARMQTEATAYLLLASVTLLCFAILLLKVVGWIAGAEFRIHPLEWILLISPFPVVLSIIAFQPAAERRVAKAHALGVRSTLEALTGIRSRHWRIALAVAAGALVAVSAGLVIYSRLREAGLVG